MSTSMDDKPDNFSDEICAICDNGGDLICCEGKCLRSFHATVEAGTDGACCSLQMSRNLINENFTCENCWYNRHQCYVCGKLGSSDESFGVAEVLQCSYKTCGYFYHPSCVVNSLRFKYENELKDVEADIAYRKPFICPLHFCHVCKQKEREHETKSMLQFAVCRRCPTAYHKKCLPRTIAFEADDDQGIITRAWEDLIPNKVMIYCMEHLIDEELETPSRDHIKFPFTHLKNLNNEEHVLDESVAEVKNVSMKRHHHPLKVLEKINVSKQCSEKLLEDGQVEKSSSYSFRDRKLVTKYKMVSLVLGMKRKATTTLDECGSSFGKNMSGLLSNKDSSNSEKRMTSHRELEGSKLENRWSAGSEKRRSSEEEETNKDFVSRNLVNPKATGFKKRRKRGHILALAACNKKPLVGRLKSWEKFVSNKRKRSNRSNRKVEGNKDSLAEENQKTTGLVIIGLEACNKSRSYIEVEGNKDSLVEEASLECIRKNIKEEVDRCSSGGFDDSHSNVKVDSTCNRPSSSTSDMHNSTSCSQSVFRSSLGFYTGPYFPLAENNHVGWLTE